MMEVMEDPKNIKEKIVKKHGKKFGSCNSTFSWVIATQFSNNFEINFFLKSSD